MTGGDATLEAMGATCWSSQVYLRLECKFFIAMPLVFADTFEAVLIHIFAPSDENESDLDNFVSGELSASIIKAINNMPVTK